MVRWLLLSGRCLVGEEAALRGVLEPSPRLRELGGLARLVGAERPDLGLALLERGFGPGKGQGQWGQGQWGQAARLGVRLLGRARASVRFGVKARDRGGRQLYLSVALRSSRSSASRPARCSVAAAASRRAAAAAPCSVSSSCRSPDFSASACACSSRWTEG